ncbi:MAG: ATP-binding protein, partial [bacterium]|nr:ATP-binding protein [bacterium]
ACLPIIRQGKAVGLVYLENNQIEGVFTEKRMEPLGILAAQAAIALENAILVNEITESNKNLEAKVEEQVKELEDTRAYAEKVQQQTSYANLTKGIAHEIRNPLGMMMTNTQALMRQIKRGDEQEKQLKHLDMLLNSTRRLKDTLDSMLKFDKGHRDLEMKPVLINAIIEEIVSLSKLETDQQKVEIIVNYDQSIPTVPGHAISIRQMFTNIYLNALQAFEKDAANKRITISTELSHFKRDKKNIPAVKISIKDTGIGIPEAEIDHLFDAFHTTKYENMGIGLSIVLQLVNSHNGKIDVSSEPGKGSEFSILLPIETNNTTKETVPVV